MQHTFDVMWLERRRSTLVGKGVAEAEWKAYLYQSFADNKPLDELVREILAADGADPELRAAAKFYLDRDAEPNLLARDVGRLFFGHDLQCAQCHDHPLVDDYLQAEYYGLMAFVSRGSVFTDAKDESKLYYRGAGRRRDELQVGVHRQRSRPRAARAAGWRAGCANRSWPRRSSMSSHRRRTCGPCPSTAAGRSLPRSPPAATAPRSTATWRTVCGRRCSAAASCIRWICSTAATRRAK